MKGPATCCKIECAILKYIHIFCGLGTYKILTINSEKIWHPEFIGKRKDFCTRIKLFSN